MNFTLNELYMLQDVLDDWIYEAKQREADPYIREARRVREKVSKQIEEEENK